MSLSSETRTKQSQDGQALVTNKPTQHNREAVEKLAEMKTLYRAMGELYPHFFFKDYPDYETFCRSYGYALAKVTSEQLITGFKKLNSDEGRSKHYPQPQELAILCAGEKSFAKGIDVDAQMKRTEAEGERHMLRQLASKPSSHEKGLAEIAKLREMLNS